MVRYESPLTWAILRDGVPQRVDDYLVLCVLPSKYKTFQAARLMSPRSRAIIRSAFEEVLGLSLALEAKIDPGK